MKNKHPVLRRFMRRKVSVVAAALLILFVLIAILGPLVWQVDPLKQSVMKKYGPMRRCNIRSARTIWVAIRWRV